ncbi:MAG TPA: hypothetical protein DDZ51_15580 [Planctomycetaceae bacterium]|nr:hypothetical protein [Planctomycetaceae bacterium]
MGAVFHRQPLKFFRFADDPANSGRERAFLNRFGWTTATAAYGEFIGREREQKGATGVPAEHERTIWLSFPTTLGPHFAASLFPFASARVLRIATALPAIFATRCMACQIWRFTALRSTGCERWFELS